jgi:hypothetical protein
VQAQLTRTIIELIVILFHNYNLILMDYWSQNKSQHSPFSMLKPLLKEKRKKVTQAKAFSKQSPELNYTKQNSTK